MTILGRLRTIWTGVAGSPYYTNLYFTSDAGGANDQAFCDAWTTFLGNIDTEISSALSVAVEPTVALIDDATGTLVGSSGIAPNTFTPAGGGEMLPPFTQALIQLQTGAVVAGRLLRGRIFIPGMQETNNTTTGVPSGTMVAGVNTALGTFLGSDGEFLVVYSPTHHDSFSVNTMTMWTQWAVLRSRRD